MAAVAADMQCMLAEGRCPGGLLAARAWQCLVTMDQWAGSRQCVSMLPCMKSSWEEVCTAAWAAGTCPVTANTVAAAIERTFSSYFKHPLL
jgi:hypothetical protein